MLSRAAFRSSGLAPHPKAHSHCSSQSATLVARCLRQTAQGRAATHATSSATATETSSARLLRTPQARSRIAKHRQRHGSQACCARPLGGRQRRAGSQAETSKFYSFVAFRKLFNRSLPPRASMLQKKSKNSRTTRLSHRPWPLRGVRFWRKREGYPPSGASARAGQRRAAVIATDTRPSQSRMKFYRARWNPVVRATHALADHDNIAPTTAPTMYMAQAERLRWVFAEVNIKYSPRSAIPKLLAVASFAT